jgi:hypothetical protein
MEQIITPNPNIACTPGLCLVYEREVFNVAATGKYPTAISNWNNGQGNHPNEAMPSGVGVPIFFTVAGNSAGHVAHSVGDGSIYSSSSPTSHTPIHHANLAAMQQYWANGSMLTYLGWKESIEDTLVVKESNMATPEQITATINYLHEGYFGVSAPADVVESWTGLLTLDYINGEQTILEYCNTNPDALKNKQQDVISLTQQITDLLATKATDETTITDLNAQIEALKAVIPPEAPTEPVAPTEPTVTSISVTNTPAPVIHATAPKQPNVFVQSFENLFNAIFKKGK